MLSPATDSHRTISPPNSTSAYELLVNEFDLA
jgi:hypothetical protein